MRLYDTLIGDEKVKEELKIMEMTGEDKVFLATKNFADVLEKGREEGRTEGIEIGFDTSLSIIRDLNAHKPTSEIAELYKISIRKVEEIQTAMKSVTA